MVYRSKDQIDKKLLQVKHIQRDINKFSNRIFINNGIDPETGVHPLIVHTSSFLSAARSIIQYALKEAKEQSKQAVFDGYVKDVAIFKLFKDIRDSDIHAYTVGVHSSIAAHAPMNPEPIEPSVYQTATVNFEVETLDDINEPRDKNGDVSVSYTLGKRVIVEEELIENLKSEGNQKILDAIDNGQELYEDLECENIADLHKLCEMYVVELEKFIGFGVSKGFIT